MRQERTGQTGLFRNVIQQNFSFVLLQRDNGVVTPVACTVPLLPKTQLRQERAALKRKAICFSAVSAERIAENSVENREVPRSTFLYNSRYMIIYSYADSSGKIL